MDFIEKVQDLAHRLPKQIDHIQTEEATKSALVMPFIQALGYDVFNPLEVVPEFTADIGTKKGEKVDYAIKKNDQTVMLFECKWCGSNLEECHAAQLYRYFSVTDARFGILTNGVYYKFFSDIDKPNKMDSKPFFEFNLKDFDEHKVEELKKFSKSTFELENIIASASELKYTNSIKRLLSEEFSSPSDEFVKFFASQVYSKRMTQQALDQFRDIFRRASTSFLREKLNEKLKSAFEEAPVKEEAESETVDTVKEEDPDYGIVTTEEEHQAFNIVKAIVREVVDVKRIHMRDRKSYCGILLDDNNRKPICRFHFDSAQKYIGLISNKKEERVPIENLDDIFQYSERLKNAVSEYIEAAK